jgi:RNA exonuclease 4
LIKHQTSVGFETASAFLARIMALNEKNGITESLTSVPKYGVSNWKQLQSKLSRNPIVKEKKAVSDAKRRLLVVSEEEPTVPGVSPDIVSPEPETIPKSASLRQWEKKLSSRIIGLDCEMVGIGFNGKESVLARCSIVDFHGNVLYDKIVRPKSFVTDFRTKYSGIKKSDFRKKKGSNIATLEECQQFLAALLKGKEPPSSTLLDEDEDEEQEQKRGEREKAGFYDGKPKILVGHALTNDFNVLLLSHPRALIRDTAHYHPYMKEKRNGKFRSRALKDLSYEFLGKVIQQGEHDSVSYRIPSWVYSLYFWLVLCTSLLSRLVNLSFVFLFCLTFLYLFICLYLSLSIAVGD